MDKVVNLKIEEYLNNFKKEFATKFIQGNLYSLSPRDGEQILKFVQDYKKLTLTKEDLVKRKRVKNTINSGERCIAKRANGEQCSRRRKDSDKLYCGTHEKGRPHGEIEVDNTQVKKEHTTQVFAQEIKGIIYYLDNNGNVYNTEEIIGNKPNPKIIAKYSKVGEEYTIPEFNI